MTGQSSLITEIGHEWPARIGKTVKGMFVALALVVALEREPDPRATLLALAGAVLAFMVGELYDAAIEAQIRNRRGLAASEFRGIALDQSFISVGATPVMVIFAFAAAGLLSASLADNIAVWTGVVLLGLLGYVAARLAHESAIRCVRYGLESAVVGALVVALKVLVKEI
jgi:hypothetical protein